MPYGHGDQQGRLVTNLTLLNILKSSGLRCVVLQEYFIVKKSGNRDQKELREILHHYLFSYFCPFRNRCLRETTDN
ncbi:hypothetical protein CLV82_1670 [Zeaxanthinibacter enoshimensis]|uniref:Uncharacterized protein n=1 Tax=Zeaxanthinibacter enoshimensis TaxID=392009 RepID=A0A4R6TKI7_9FLAO|nr:hypothetical protein CLV82_1670 [Zeaxanthinibacter enoshimensis]